MKMFKYTRFILVLLVAVALVGLIQVGAAEKKVKISFMHHWTGTDPKAKTFEPALKAFQAKNPDIELEVIANPGAKAETRIKLPIAFSAGAAPDVFLFDGGLNLEPYVRAGKIADLTILVKEDRELKSKFMPGTMDLVTYGGKLYGLPLEFWTEHIFVNTKIFKKYNLNLPKTYDEFREAVKTLKANSIIPITFANKGGAQGGFLFSIFLAALSDADTLKNACAGSKGVKFTDKPFVRTAEVLMELAKLGAYPQGVNALPRDIAVSFFNDEKAAMYVDGSTAAGLIKLDMQKDVALLPYPFFPGETPNSTALIAFPANFIEVNAETAKDPAKFAAAIKLIKYLSSKEVVRPMIERSGHISPVLNVWFNQTKLPPLQTAILKTLKAAKDMRWHFNTSIYPTVYTKVNDALANMFDGIGTPESNMKMVQEKLDQVMAETK